MAVETRTLQLEKNVDYSATVFLVEKGWKLQFFLDVTLDHSEVRFYTNHTADSDFDPDLFFCVEWMKKSNTTLFPECFAEVFITRAGVFKFYLGNDSQRFCCGSFIVQPTLLKVTGDTLNIESITMQTVLSKNLGAFSEWKKRLQVAYKTNFNVIHFSPVQELGESNSCYSIRDHLNYNSIFSDNSASITDKSLTEILKSIHSDWGVFSIIDVVWNHVSNDCQWIKEHTDASYNLVNTPHLRPAFLVDRVLWYFNEEISKGQWRKHGIPNFINSKEHLSRISNVLREKLIKIQLEDFFTVDIDSMCREVANILNTTPREEWPARNDEVRIEIKQDREYKRKGCAVNVNDVMAKFSHYSTTHECCRHLRQELGRLNAGKKQFIDDVINRIIESTIGHIRYHFVDSDGPKYGEVTEDNSISIRYFCYPFTESNYERDIELMDGREAELIMAHNGWVMGGDAVKGFIGEDSLVFLRRELFAWGDSIKLRYGDRPDDSPFLWDYMRQYTEKMARMFHGFRIDNCHSTPMHVAEYLINCARQINPDLFVMAELFTNSECTDNLFVNRLGLNAMIRENMGAFSPYDLGRHIHRFGGQPVGSFLLPSQRPLLPCVAPALFMDITHDNESLMKKRSVFDFLSSCGLVAAAGCATGSTRGFDEIVPHYIHVVNERRVYQKWSEKYEEGGISLDTGLMRARNVLNRIHVKLKEDGFTEIYVDQMTENIVAVTRHSPATHQSIIFVGHCAFSEPAHDQRPKLNTKYHESFPPLKIEGTVDDVLFEGQLLQKNSEVFQKNDRFINGLTNYILLMQERIKPSQAKLCNVTINEKGTEVHFKNFFPGSVLVVKVSGRPNVQTAINQLRHTLNRFEGHHLPVSKEIESLSGGLPDIKKIVGELSLVDLNRVLYRCDNEERDDGRGGGVYNIPGFGDLVYCGLQGIMSIITEVAEKNDLGHPICKNLREGNWMLAYTANRLKSHLTTAGLASWLENVFDYISCLPRFLVPAYFEAVVRGVYKECQDHAFKKMSDFVHDGSPFAQQLSLGTIQLCGEVQSSHLPAVLRSQTPHLFDPKINYDSVTMAAGLPHFATGFMRCWGRDTFISLRGLMLITGRFDIARNLILSYSSCIRHGLVPNLLASGVGARYNARDATWFWLQALQQYSRLAPEGCDILKAKVFRLYPHDDSEAVLMENYLEEEQEKMSCPLEDLVHEILQRHFQGISFRERNAGERLDRDMSDVGFNIEAGVCLDTGFVFGGSQENCGTWMDKMGSSRLAENAGHPATPRDGSAVEIVGLSKSTLSWLIELNKLGKYPYNVVEKEIEKGKLIKLSYSEWNDLIQNNFEDKFYVSANPPETEKLVNKRMIYKDSYKSSNGFTDFQLRPNVPVAMCAAPELFDPAHACTALEIIEKHLLGPLGLATLDPTDWAYNGFYENHIDSTEFKTSKGFNYHQGPEWTWVLGPFLRAKLIMAKRLKDNNLMQKTIKRTREILSNHKGAIQQSPWKGLTELTNKGGAYCSHSCPTQAWSLACLLEVLYDVENEI